MGEGARERERDESLNQLIGRNVEEGERTKKR